MNEVIALGYEDCWLRFGKWASSVGGMTHAWSVNHRNQLMLRTVFDYSLYLNTHTHTYITVRARTHTHTHTHLQTHTRYLHGLTFQDFDLAVAPKRNEKFGHWTWYSAGE